MQSELPVRVIETCATKQLTDGRAAFKHSQKRLPLVLIRLECVNPAARFLVFISIRYVDHVEICFRARW